MYQEEDDDGSHFKGLLDSFNMSTFNENAKEKETKEKCPVVKTPGSNKRKRNK